MPENPTTTRAQMKRRVILKRLLDSGIATLGDLDRWRNAQRWVKAGRPFMPSRYSALVSLVGEDAADLIMNELAIRQCTSIGGVR